MKRTDPKASNARIIHAIKSGVRKSQIAKQEKISRTRVTQIWDRHQRGPTRVAPGFEGLGTKAFVRLKKLMKREGVSPTTLNDVKRFFEENPGWRPVLSRLPVGAYEEAMPFLVENGIISRIERNEERIELLLNSVPEPRRAERCIWTFLLIESGATFTEVSNRTGIDASDLKGGYDHAINIWKTLLGEEPTFRAVWEYMTGTSVPDFQKNSHFSKQTTSGTMRFVLRLGGKINPEE